MKKYTLRIEKAKLGAFNFDVIYEPGSTSHKPKNIAYKKDQS